MEILFILTYLEIGVAIGLQELGCAPQGRSAYSRRGPFTHIFLQCLFWPLFFIVVRSTAWFEKIAKLVVVALAVFFAQKYALPYLTPHLGQWWALLPLVIGAILLVLGLFAFLRMPGFRPQF